MHTCRRTSPAGRKRGDEDVGLESSQKSALQGDGADVVGLLAISIDDCKWSSAAMLPMEGSVNGLNRLTNVDLWPCMVNQHLRQTAQLRVKSGCT